MFGRSTLRTLAAATAISAILVGGVAVGPLPSIGGGVAEARKGSDSDLAQIAKDRGWTKEQAKAYQRTRVALDKVLEAIVAQAPDILVGSAFATDPLDPPTIYLKGPVPAFVTALVADAAVPITIVDGLPWNFDELEERSIRTAEALRALGFRSVSVGTEMTGTIPVTLSRVSGVTPDELAAIVAALPEDLRDSVVITVVDPPIAAFLCDPVVPASPSPSASPGASPAPASPAPSTSTEPCVDLAASWGPLAVVDDAAMGGLDAGFGPGRLFIGPRCVSLRTGQGRATTLVWRAGDTRWDPATDEILFADRDLGLIRLKSGDRVSLGGFSPGTIDAIEDEGPGLAPWLATPDETCAGELWEVHQVVPVRR